MLPRKNRIPRKDFPSHEIRGIRGFSGFFTAVFYPTKGKISRATVVVSKKTAKKAVDRNKLRRRFYEILRQYFKSIQATTAVLYPKKEAQTASFEELKKEMEQVLRKANLLK